MTKRYKPVQWNVRKLEPWSIRKYGVWDVIEAEKSVENLNKGTMYNRVPSPLLATRKISPSPQRRAYGQDTKLKMRGMRYFRNDLYLICQN